MSGAGSAGLRTAATHRSPFVNQALKEFFPKASYGKDKGEVFHQIVTHRSKTKSALTQWGAKVGEGRTYSADFFNAPKSRMELTPLHVAAMKGNRVAVKFFLENGAQLDNQDVRGWTPLHHAAARGHQAVMALMMDGQDAALLEIRNTWGARPQDFLAQVQ